MCQKSVKFRIRVVFRVIESRPSYMIIWQSDLLLWVIVTPRNIAGNIKRNAGDNTCDRRADLQIFYKVKKYGPFLI